MAVHEPTPSHLDEHLARKKAARDWAAEKGRMYRQYMTTSVIGLEVGVAIGLASIIGWWVDRQLGSAPWGMLFGLAVGMTHAGRILYGLAKKHMLEDGDDVSEDASETNAARGVTERFYDRENKRDDDD